MVEEGEKRGYEFEKGFGIGGGQAYRCRGASETDML